MEIFKILYKVEFATIKKTHYCETDNIGRSLAQEIGKAIMGRLNSNQKKMLRTVVKVNTDVYNASKIEIIKSSGELMLPTDTEALSLEIANYISDQFN